MTTHPPEPKPRRKWHLTKWLVVLIIATFGYGAWNAYAFRSALREAKALGWQVYYTAPLDQIRWDWKNTFNSTTWTDKVNILSIEKGEELQEHRSVVRRLDPMKLHIRNTQTLSDLAPLEGLTRLKFFYIGDGPNLTNLDGLQNLSRLEYFNLHGCPKLTNLDGLKDHPALTMTWITDCTALTNVDSFNNLSDLHVISLNGCTALKNIDGLKNVTTLQFFSIVGCAEITNVDALTNISALESIDLTSCTGLTKERIMALKAAHPKAEIRSEHLPPIPKP